MASFTATEKVQFVGGLVSLAVYCAVAWAAARLFNESFWVVIGWLLAVRAFFGIVEGLAGVLHWRLFRKKAAVEFFVACLREEKFPPRDRRGGDVLDYLARISSEVAPYPDSVKRSAQEFYSVLEMAEKQGILAGMRVHAAAEIALQQYSPREQAPV